MLVRFMKIYTSVCDALLALSFSSLLIFELKLKSYEKSYIDSQFDSQFAIGSGDWHFVEIS